MPPDSATQREECPVTSDDLDVPNAALDTLGIEPWSCSRPAWQSGETGSSRCIWHTKTAEKPVHKLADKINDGDLHGAIAPNTDLTSLEFPSTSGFVDADLSEADLREADLSGVVFSIVNLSEADLREADLPEADLREADISEANLREADISEADLRRADLSEANLREIDLSEADLEHADLSEASLYYAYLSGTELWEADLLGADLRDIPSRFPPHWG